MLSMYYLVEFEEDNTIDVIESSNLIFDDEVAEVGSKVVAIYKTHKKGKPSMFDSKDLSRSGKMAKCYW
jgi:hypothetical protein